MRGSGLMACCWNFTPAISNRTASARARALGVAEIVQRGDNAETALADAIDRTLSNSEMATAARAHSDRLRDTDPLGLAASLLESLA